MKWLASMFGDRSAGGLKTGRDLLSFASDIASHTPGAVEKLIAYIRENMPDDFSPYFKISVLDQSEKIYQDNLAAESAGRSDPNLQELLGALPGKKQLEWTFVTLVAMSVFFVACWEHHGLQCFVDKIKKIARGVKRVISQNREKSVVFNIPQNVTKSNLWVCSLVGGEIVDLLKDRADQGEFFVVNGFGRRGGLRELGLPGDQIVVFEFDDMSYSGI